MPSEPVLRITYWGVTGSIAAPLRPAEVTDKIVGAIHRLLADGRLPAAGVSVEEIRHIVELSLPFELRATYGGNTTCLEVQTPDALLILDLGSGFRELGLSLQERWDQPGYTGPRSAHVLFSHPHLDHTHAVPYVDVCFDPRNHFTLWGPQAVRDSLEAVLRPGSPLSHIFFPPTYDVLKALGNFHTVEAGASFVIGSTRVRTFALKHPGGGLAYRLENAGHAFVFVTDHEPAEVPDRALAAFADQADLLYMDGQYLEREYEGRAGIKGEKPISRRGWGHGSMEASVATAVAAGVRALHVGHREPRRSDAGMAQLEGHLQHKMREGLRAAGRDENACRACIPYEGLMVML
jgi:phosphoribosyl 1,2-cyclic phosphodiesterase